MPGIQAFLFTYVVSVKRQDGQEAPGARKPDSLDSKLQTSGLGSEWREARVSNVRMQVTEAGTGASRPLLDAQ